jgi:hypothetical protein
MAGANTGSKGTQQDPKPVKKPATKKKKKISCA